MRASRVLTAVEAHAEGEPGRVITGGMPRLRGNTVYEKMRYLEAEHDDIRRLMLQEPRGYPALCCNAIVEPCHPDADAGLIIMEQTEYPPMSGSNTICAATVLLETGIVPMIEPVTDLTLETPAGLIEVRADCADGKVTRVTFRNVPSFVVALDATIDAPGLGEVQVDVAWGGMFYVLADADRLGVSLDPANGRRIVAVSEALRHAAADQIPAVHPDNPSVTGPTITNLWTAPTDPTTDGRGVVTVSTGPFDQDRPELASGVFDRSPCGTGTSAKMAVLHARGMLGVGEEYVNAGPLGTTFVGRIQSETSVGPYPAIVPSIAGQAWIYGHTTWTLDPTDPLGAGFTIGDVW